MGWRGRTSPPSSKARASASGAWTLVGWPRASSPRCRSEDRLSLRRTSGRPVPVRAQGYIISGTMRVHRADGSRDYEAGETYFWKPGHNLEAVSDAEYIEITRSGEYDALMAHC